MLEELWSLLVANLLSLVIWIIDTAAFCSTTKKNSFIISCIIQILRIIMYISSGLWYPCVSSGASFLIFSYNAFFKFHNLIFNSIISIILIVLNIIQIVSTNSINTDSIIPIVSFLISVSGITFCKSMHSLRIFKGTNALLYLYYYIKHTIIFSATQNLFVVLLMFADILINKFDNDTGIAKEG